MAQKLSHPANRQFMAQKLVYRAIRYFMAQKLSLSGPLLYGTETDSPSEPPESSLSQSGTDALVNTRSSVAMGGLFGYRVFPHDTCRS